MKNQTLDRLVHSDDIKSYEYHNIDCDGNIGKESEDHNSEILYITFPSGKTIRIHSDVSGCLENSSLWITEVK